MPTHTITLTDAQHRAIELELLDQGHDATPEEVAAYAQKHLTAHANGLIDERCRRLLDDDGPSGLSRDDREALLLNRYA